MCICTMIIFNLMNWELCKLQHKYNPVHYHSLPEPDTKASLEG